MADWSKKFLNGTQLAHYTNILQKYIEHNLKRLYSEFNGRLSDATDTSHAAFANAATSAEKVNSLLDKYQISIEEPSAGETKYSIYQGTGDSRKKVGAIDNNFVVSCSVEMGTWSGSTFTPDSTNGKEQAIALHVKGQENAVYIKPAEAVPVAKAGTGIDIENNVVSVHFGAGENDVASGAKLQTLWNIHYPTEGQRLIFNGGGDIEYGVDTAITLSWSVSKKVEGKNVDVPITDVKLYKDNILLDGITASTKNYTDTIREAHTYKIEVTTAEGTVSGTKVYNTYDCCYVGYSLKDNIAGEEIPALKTGTGNGEAYKSNGLDGMYTLNVPTNSYVYVCLPSSKTLKKWLSDGSTGFPVGYTIINGISVQGKYETYTVYRTDKLAAVSASFYIKA